VKVTLVPTEMCAGLTDTLTTSAGGGAEVEVGGAVVAVVEGSDTLVVEVAAEVEVDRALTVPDVVVDRWAAVAPQEAARRHRLQIAAIAPRARPRQR
jgi:hypothetical protein